MTLTKEEIKGIVDIYCHEHQNECHRKGGCKECNENSPLVEELWEKLQPQPEINKTELLRCPKCHQLTFVYDPCRKVSNCLRLQCGYIEQPIPNKLRGQLARAVCFFAQDNNSCAECKEILPPSRVRPDSDCFKETREQTEAIHAIYQPLLERAKAEGRQEVIERIEKLSHPMNTNMYGISLSKAQWQALKEDK